MFATYKSASRLRNPPQDGTSVLFPFSKAEWPPLWTLLLPPSPHFLHWYSKWGWGEEGKRNPTLFPKVCCGQARPWEGGRCSREPYPTSAHTTSGKLQCPEQNTQGSSVFPNRIPKRGVPGLGQWEERDGGKNSGKAVRASVKQCQNLAKHSIAQCC